MSIKNVVKNLDIQEEFVKNIKGLILNFKEQIKYRDFHPVTLDGSSEVMNLVQEWAESQGYVVNNSADSTALWVELP
jgi:hypothetical protein